MADGVRRRHPGLDDKAVLAMVARQLDRLKALEAHDTASLLSEIRASVPPHLN